MEFVSNAQQDMCSTIMESVVKLNHSVKLSTEQLEFVKDVIKATESLMVNASQSIWLTLMDKDAKSGMETNVLNALQDGYLMLITFVKKLVIFAQLGPQTEIV